MINHQEIERTLAELINSETLSKSLHSKQLLEYLVKATLEKRDIKEYTIAKEVFNKESDTGVRAYIHNLRKKLDEYYISEGRDAEFILTIPKGQYYVQVDKRAPKASKSVRKKLYLLLSGIVIIAAAFFFWLNTKNKELEDTVIWKDIIDSENPLLIVVGDHYFFHSRIATGNIGLTRDFYIQSEKELDEWLDTNKQSLKDSIFKINYTYTTKQGAMSIFQLSPYLKKSQHVQLVLSSELTYEQIKKNNILYLGKYFTMGILKNMVDKKYFHEDRKSGDVSYFQKDTTIKHNLIISPSFKEDYPVVLKFKTPYKKSVMMIVSADDPGNAAALDYFLDVKNIQWLEKELQLSEKENSFSALFKAKGIERTDFSIDFITGEKIVE